MVDRVLDRECVCVPCESPAYGHPALAHCAACCAGSMIESYDHGCPIPDHRELAEAQWGSLQAEVDVAATETAARLDIIVARLDWDWLANQWNELARAKKIHRTYDDRFRSPEHVVAIIEGKEPYDDDSADYRARDYR